ncbi:type IV secretory system conjugative DNA transfer family protein [Acidiferrimicrobium sp. IK]|uniref:type IV secretory system conjugative DNA transfer family protein n=1 Tax=Acidiferrimicrobium sp. IK TaxID=2871700 RepID=UPI0021CB3F28|nr:type IV secretory system conjugative DNA transfer family protein [Acidiferrimicrobium sp. IK]MCU4187220.1 type IV secretory system conjugative DNA transfer family protein [Acidiferrimicrobium sp. IK]
MSDTHASGPATNRPSVDRWPPPTPPTPPTPPARMSVPARQAPPLMAAWHGLFLGGGTVGPVLAGAQQCVLVLGPPRSGKTTALIVPNVQLAPGAAVATSTKTDVIGWTARTRARRGRLWLFDPSGTIPTPAGLTRLGWSPVPGCEQWREAVATAHVLARAATRPGRVSTDGDHWSERAEALLAPLLHAAALAGLDVSWVLRWVLRREVTEPAGLLVRRGGDEIAAETLSGIAATDERERSGIFSTAAGVLAAYRSPDALAVAAAPNFDPDAFVRSSDTLYLAAPAEDQEQLAPIVVALLDRLRRATYRREPGWPPVVWALDEVANIAPLPNLPSIVAEGASQGLVTMACLQDLSQARVRWGAAADGFLTLFGTKVVLPGVADMRTLQLVSALAGETHYPIQSLTEPVGWWNYDKASQRTTSWERRPVLPVDRVHHQTPGTALVIQPGQPPARVDLIPCWAAPIG